MSENFTKQDFEQRIKTLEEREETYQKIMEAAPDAIAITRLSDGKHLEVNEAFCRLTGYSAQEVIGRTPLDLNLYINPDDRKRLVEAVGKYGQVDGAQITIQAKDRSLLHFLVSIRVIPFKGEDCILTIFTVINSLIEAQNALQEREETYRMILATAPDAIIITRRSDGKYLEVNEAFCRQTGYSSEEVLGKTAIDLNLYANPSDRERLVEASREHGQVDGMQITFRTKNGTLLHDLVSLRIIQFRGEECVLIVATVITPLIEAQNALRESEERYRQILNAAPDTITIKNLNNDSYLEVNDTYCQRSGYSREEVIGRTPEELNTYTVPNEREFMLEALQKNDGRVDGFETRYRNKFGDIGEVLVSARLIQYQGQECLLSISKNINDLKNAQKALQESEQKYRTILETMEDGYFETDLAGNFTFLNNSMCENYGYSHDELMGMNNREYTSAKEAKRIYGTYSQIYKTERPAYIYDHDVICKDGSIKTFETSASLLKNASDEPIGFRGITRNVTERKKAEKELEQYRQNLERMVQERTRELESAQEELLQKEKLAILGQLTATVSHELRNPLGVIRSSNFYLRRRLNDGDPKIDKHFRRIDEQISICDSIVADLLEYTRGRHAEVVRSELNSWMDPLLDELLELEGVTVKKHLTGTTIVPHDQEKIRRLIVNITDNALQAVRSKQEAWKDNEKTYDPEIFIGTREVDDGVIVEIRDNGTGMDKETLDQAIEPLFTTRARGTGIGLANVDKIVKEHNGKLTIESEPNQGTCVTIFLPYKTV